MGAVAPQAVLRVADVGRSISFYCSDLALMLDLYDEAAGHALISGADGVRLLLAVAGADSLPWLDVPVMAHGAWVYLQRPDIPAFAAALAARGIKSEGPVSPYPGYRHLLVTDPDGYVIIFWEPLPVSDAEILQIYQMGPSRLRTAVTGLDNAACELRRAPSKWSIRQIVHHLVDSDLNTFHVLQFALALPGRQIQSNLWRGDEWAAGLCHATRAIEPAVALLEAARTWVLDAIGHIPDALSRSVSWASGYRAEVRDLMRQAGGHALHHIGQIEEIRQRNGQ